MSKADLQGGAPVRTGTPVWRVRALALAAAAVANLIVIVVAQAVGVDMTVVPPGRPTDVVGADNVLFMTLAVGAVGWLARAVLDRWARRRAALIWLIGASVVFALDIVPVVLVEATGDAKATLMALHVVMSVILFPVLGRRLPESAD